MKCKYRNTLLAAVAGLALAMTPGCKKFLDVNENPNAPKIATDNLILPSTQAAVGMVVGNHLQVFGGLYAQYWTQNPTSSQYKSMEQYQASPAASNRLWGILYNDALQDLQLLEQSKNSSYVAIALLQKAYIFQLLTDAFGDVPLTEALQGSVSLSPHYNSQQQVYDSIFAWTKRGIALTTVGTSNFPGNVDLVFGAGNPVASGTVQMENWKRFGNTLLLRAYLRLSQVDPAKAQAGINELYAANPVFLTTDAKIVYQSVGGNQNPLYAEGVGLNRVQNLVASSTSVSAFASNGDPRLNRLYVPNENGDITGVPQGSYATQPAVGPSYPSPLTGANFTSATGATAAVAPVILLSAAESYFLQAEAIARGWATGNAEALFQAGIKASFDALAIPTSEYETYMATAPAAQLPAETDRRMEAIITQKYFAMNGRQGFEAWTEYRRTGYPKFLVVSAASALGTQEKPARLIYPETEITRNANFPGIKRITETVWWDTE